MNSLRPTPVNVFAKGYLRLSRDYGETKPTAFEKIAQQRQTDEQALAEWHRMIAKVRAADGNRV